jgi:glycosyltransferase involved in cell wall biosynthesis
MRVLLVHNFYTRPGGEDVMFRAEGELLRANGVEILEYTEHNRRINQHGRVALAIRSVWSWESYARLKQKISEFHPDIAHFHNTFPLISPSAYYACKEFAVPVVQTLHNFRLVCPAATLYRSGAVCEKCIDKKFPWPGIYHQCYHASALQTAVISTLIFTHGLLRTWERAVDALIVLTNFAKAKFRAAGFPEEKLFLKPNFVEDHNASVIPKHRDRFFVYAGRLTSEKGIGTLYEAWRTIDAPIYVFGNGSLPGIQSTERFRLMDYAERQTVSSYLRRAQALIFPSEWYEGFPVILAEAFASSLPVIAAGMGSHAEIVEDRKTGLHFRPGDAGHLASQVEWLLQNPQEQARMAENARREYEQKYTPEKNLRILTDIYSHVLAGKGG